MAAVELAVPGDDRVVLRAAVRPGAGGVYLLWAFPDWETMQVAHSHASLLPWLVTVFAITNVTQGMLGLGLLRG